MKRILLLFAVLSISGGVKLMAQKSSKHESKMSYAFDHAFIRITNEFAKDSAQKLSPEYILPPYDNRKIFAYGPTVTVSFTAMPAAVPSFDFFYRNYYIPQGAEILDTLERVPALFDVKWLQVQVEFDGRILRNWESILLIGKSQLRSKQATQPSFILFSDTVDAGESVRISFRNSKTLDTLISFSVERIRNPLQPFLAKWHRDTSGATTYEQFLAKPEIIGPNEASRDSFYWHWPDKYSGKINKERVFPNSKVVLYFRKPVPNYSDSTLEYAILDHRSEDTVWSKAGHSIFLPKFNHGTSRRVLIRYKENPSSIKEYSFYTDPAWYQTNRFFWILGSSILIISLLSFLIRYAWKLRVEKRKVRAATISLQSIRGQLNPHFVFNALSSIQSLVNSNANAEANHYLSEFSDLLRQTLRNSDREMIPLEQELKLLEVYLSLEQLRYPFKYDLRVDDSIRKSLVEVPSFLLQPIIENSIRHALGALGENGLLTILYEAQSNDLSISVTDNGAGFDTGKIKTDGYGLKLTRDRITALNYVIKPRHIHFDIRSSATGTIVHLKLQNWLLA